MKSATVKLLKKELENLDRTDLTEIIIRLSKFKKENKELLSYLIFESADETTYVNDIKIEVNTLFNTMNCNSYFYMKKTIRKILKIIKTYIRYSNVQETEVELLLYFCTKLKAVKPSISNHVQLNNLYHRELKSIACKIQKLHPDLQYDYTQHLNTHIE